MGAAVLACGVSATLWRAAIDRRSQLFSPSVFRGPGRRRSVALTFDDGPSPSTARLLHYLAVEDVRATFFLCGINVNRHPETARSVAESGHELGNHTYSHPRLCPRLGWQLNLRSPGENVRELTRAQDAIRAATGVSARLFRAPYGMRWWGLRRAQRRLGLLHVHWTVIGHDWEWSAAQVAEHVLRRATPGGIICLHDGRDIQLDPDVSVMLEAVRIIVPELRRRGYRFETVSDLLLPDDLAPDEQPL